MEFHVLDECMALDGRGIVLISMDEACALLYSGVEITDARGNTHTVAEISPQESAFTLYLPGGEAAYFERLLRDVRVDATRFCFAPKEDSLCP
ncbi:MAG: hypothetical protein RSC91_08085 [Clostridia bacterium]